MMTKTQYVEESTVNLPFMQGGNGRIGALWDCHSSSFFQDNIFTTLLLDRQHLEALPTKSSEYSLTSVTNSANKRDAFHISAEVTFDLLNGALMVGGGISFDKSSAKEFNEEEFLALYNIHTYLIRTRRTDALDQLVDPDLRRRIVSGELGATHYVAEVQLGGMAIASLSARKHLSESLLDLKGSLKGSLNLQPYISVPITLGLKLSLGFLDEEGASSFSKTIKFQSLPEIPGPLDLDSVKDMFTRVESIDEALKECHFPPFDSACVYGFPIAFKLRPLGELFETGVDPVYRKLEKDLKEDFVAMLLAANDFVGPNYVTSTLWGMYHPLGALFAPPRAPSTTTTAKSVVSKQRALPGDSDENESMTVSNAGTGSRGMDLCESYAASKRNPLTQEILGYEAELEKVAKSIRKSGLDLMAEYKKGKATSADLASALLSFNEQLQPVQVKERLRDFYSRGRALLHAVHSQDVDVDSPVIFLKSNQEVDDWLNEVRPGVAKILLTTGGAVPLPGSVFTDFFALSGAAGENGIEVAVAYPNTKGHNSLSINFDVARRDKYWKEADIRCALNLLLAKVDSALVPSPKHGPLGGQLRAHLYRLFAQVLFGTTSFALNLPRFHTAFFDPFKDLGVDRIAVCETYIQFLDVLATGGGADKDEADELKLVLPIQAVESAYDQVYAYGSLCTFLQRMDKAPAHKWVAGFFSPLASCSLPAPAPILLVFRGHSLLAVCIDQLDLQILMRELHENGLRSGSDNPLSAPEMGQHCWNHVHASVGRRLLEYLASLDDPLPVPAPAAFPTPDTDRNGGLVEAQTVCRLVALNNLSGLLTFLTAAVLQPLPELALAVARHTTGSWTLERGWTGFMEHATPWLDLLKELETFSEKEDNQGHGASARLAFKCLNLALCGLAEFFEGGNVGLLKDRLQAICDYYVRAVGDGDPEFKERRQELVLGALKLEQYFHACSLLARHECNHKLMQFRDQLAPCSNLESGDGWDLTRIRHLVTGMGHFNMKEHEAVWLNPKWRYTLHHAGAENSNLLIQTLQLQHWPQPQASSTPTRPPAYLPDFIIARISEQLVHGSGNLRSCDPIVPNQAYCWKTLQQLTAVLRRASTRQRLPNGFTRTLQESLVASPALRLALRECDALLYWKGNEGRLQEPWDLVTAQHALSALTRIVNKSPNRNEKKDTANGTASVEQTGVNSSCHQRPLQVQIRPEYAEWCEVTGGVVHCMTSSSVATSLLTQGLLTKPHINLDGDLETILPWALQRLQLGDMRAVLHTLHVGRDDFWALLSACVDPWLLQRLLLQLMKHHKGLALPLICTNIVEGRARRFACPLPLYYSRHSCTAAADEGLRVIVCVRHYNQSREPTALGKTSILNRVFCEGWQEGFGFLASDSEAVRVGRRSITARAGQGYVEFVDTDMGHTSASGTTGQVGQSTSALRVVNVHGDVLDPGTGLTPPLRWLLTPPTLGMHAPPELVIFWSVDTHPEFKVKYRTLRQDILGQVTSPRRLRLHHLFLEPGSRLREGMRSAGLNNQCTIETRDLDKPETVSYIRAIFSRVVSKANAVQLPGATALSCKAPEGIHFITLPPSTREVDALFGHIEQTGIPTIRQLLRLHLNENLKGEDDGAWKELTTLVLPVLLTASGPHPQFSAWRHLATRLQEASHKATAGVRARIHALCDFLACRSEEWTREDDLSIARLTSELTTNSLSLELLFAPLLQHHAETGGFGTYWARGSSFTLSLDDKDAGMRPWVYNQVLQLCVHEMNSTFAPSSDTRVVSIVYAGRRCPGSFGSGADLVAQLFGANDPHFRSETGARFLLLPNSIRFRCFDLSKAARAPGQERLNALIVIEWAVGHPGGSTRTTDPNHTLMTTLLAASHCTLLFCPELTTHSWPVVEGLLERPLAALLELDARGCLRGCNHTHDLQVDSNIVLLAPPVIGHNHDQWNQKAQDLVRCIRNSSVSSASRALDTIQDRILQSALIQSIPDDCDGLHTLIFGECTYSERQPVSPTAWLNNTEQIWARLAKSMSLQRSISSAFQHDENRKALNCLKGRVDEVFRDHARALNDRVEQLLASLRSELASGGVPKHSVLELLEEVTTALKETGLRCKSGGDGDALCEACVRLVEGQEEWMRGAEGKDGGRTGNSSVTRRQQLQQISQYADWVRDALAAYYEQMCMAFQVRHGCSIELDALLRTICMEEEESGKEDFHEAAWARFRRFVSTFDGTISPERLMRAEIGGEYGNEVDPTGALSSITPETQLPDLAAIVEPHFVAPHSRHFEFRLYSHESPLHGPEHVHVPKLSWQQVKWLQARMQDTVRGVLGCEWDADMYRFGTVRQVKARVQDDILEGFRAEWKLRLGPAIVHAVHKTVLTLLVKRLQCAYSEWRQENSALNGLDKKRAQFPNIFSIVSN